MSETISRRSAITSLSTVMMALISITLLIAAWQATSTHQGADWGAFVWLAATIAQVAIRVPHVVRNRLNRIAVRRANRLESWLLAGVFLAELAPMIQLMTGLFSAADFALPDWATAVGAGVQVPALWLFWRSHVDLGRNWSLMLEMREDHTLVSRGVYALVRHPMYAAMLLSILSQPLLIHNWIAGFLAIPAFAALLAVRIPREEAMVRDQFGDAYVAYAARTGRLLPGVGRLRRPA